MNNTPQSFKAFVVDKKDDQFSVGVRNIGLSDLPDDEVLIRVAYSSVNFKDALASIPDGKIVNSYPFIPGIDLAGTVVESKNKNFTPGDEVLITGYGLGVAHFGGYSEYARVPAEWIVPLPSGLTMREAMAFGTAGFTAALSVHALIENGVKPDSGPVLVTGATGGVGSMAVAMLAQLGYEVTASTGKEREHGYLKELGAQHIISREELAPEKMKPLNKMKWAGAVDPVGGKTLAYVLSTTNYGGTVAVSGLTGGPKVETSVFPFILRGVKLIGIDSVECPMQKRKEIWSRIASEWKPGVTMDQICHEISFEELPSVIEGILKGNVRGRTVLKIG